MLKKHIFSTLLTVMVLALTSMAQQWRPVGGSRQSNISGMAFVEHDKEHTVLLIVHDNKKKDQGHVALITVVGASAPKVTELKWIGEEVPLDLEAATTVPGAVGQFIIFTSAGRAYHIKLDPAAATAELIRAFDVPEKPAGADFEGFALQKIGTMLIAVWADRGLTERPATLFWSKFDIARYSFNSVRSAEFKVPFPTSDVRHISDVKIDETGAVFVTSASDPGNDGPFSSAMYFAGTLTAAQDGSINFSRPASLTRLFNFAYQKVEGFEFIPGRDGGVAFGTDNENLGASIFLNY